MFIWFVCIFLYQWLRSMILVNVACGEPRMVAAPIARPGVFGMMC